jgi:hypothetical protein
MAKIERKLSEQRVKGRRIQPYAWLGAGAVTLGLGAAMASGAAVAHADSGSDAGNSGVSHSQNSNPSKAGRPAKHSAQSSAASGSAARKAQKSSASDTAEAADVTAPAATAVSSTAGSSTRSRKAAVRSTAATVDTQPAAPDTSSVASPASAPPVNQGQFIPQDIVPGKHVQLAFDGIDDAKTALDANTWGQTNILGGLAAIAPNVLLSAASFELQAWQTLNPIAQNMVAGTAGIPIIHQIAQVSLLGTMLLPALSQASLKGASLLMPVVGLFAPDAEAAASPLIKQATSDGRVYAVVRLRVYNVTEPLIDAKINGSGKKSLLVDTGSSGLVIDEANAGTLDPANIVGTGSGSYSGGFDYDYVTYKNTTVDFGSGVVSDPTYVNVIPAGSGKCGTKTCTLEEFLVNAGAVGILGTGANAYGPGPNPIPTSTLSGELSDGMLMYQNLLPFGLGGFVVFGPNPLPPKATLSGTPTSTILLTINNNPQTPVVSLIDSGGVYGTIPTDLLPGSTPFTYVPSGTKISVSGVDAITGKTVPLYSYTTGSNPYAPIVVGATDESPDGNYLNTGYYAFNQGPVYIDYRNDGIYNNGGYGWTVFDIA